MVAHTIAAFRSAGVARILLVIHPDDAGKPAGEWEAVDITLVDRHVTVVLNGEKIIDNQPAQGVTGGAMWSDEAKPGPLYLQGDHGTVSYRNLVLRPVVK